MGTSSDSCPRSDVPGDQVDALAHALRHVWYSLVRGMTHAPELEGVQKQGFWVLGGVMHGPRRMSDLAEAVELSSANLTGIVDKLEQRGLVVRERSAEDRRVVTVSITDAGRDGMRAAHKAFAERLDELLEPLEPAERRELARLLTKMSDRRGSVRD